MLRVYVTNLRSYNEGELVGEWLEYPTTKEDIDATIERVAGGRGDEIFLTDWEGDFTEALGVGEYSNLYKLQEEVEKLEALGDGEIDKVIAYIEAYGLEELDDIIHKLDDMYIIYDINDAWDLGYYWIHEAGIYNLDNLGELGDYIDYERLGQDLLIADFDLLEGGGVLSVAW